MLNVNRAFWFLGQFTFYKAYLHKAVTELFLVTDVTAFRKSLLRTEDFTLPNPAPLLILCHLLLLVAYYFHYLFSDYIYIFNKIRAVRTTWCWQAPHQSKRIIVVIVFRDVDMFGTETVFLCHNFKWHFLNY